ncbi:putative membrane protein [Clostridioides difficile 842]|nr:putative membrane protein [Clostridioides difficile 842]EQG42661.1 putative membrane protein [Clostridioides difficile DA00131]EQH52887.1 putative membrane protein [Clostridioides difficile DA00245]EQH71077.1 putative membrane protein [Clostridioides difficile DA00306]
MIVVVKIVAVIVVAMIVVVKIVAVIVVKMTFGVDFIK